MNRIAGIDVARGLAMILVILGHALEMFFNKELSALITFDPLAYEIWRVIYSFHMPAFFFISGMTLSMERKTWQKVIVDSASLLLMAYLTHLIGCVIAIAIHNPTYASLTAMLRPLGNGWQGLSLRITWFIVSLAVVQILSYVFLRYGVVAKIAVAVGVVVLYLLATSRDFHWFYSQTLIVGVSFYLLGYALKSQMKQSGFSLRTSAIACGASLLVLLLTYRLNGGCMLNPVGSCTTEGRPSFSVVIVAGRFGFFPIFLVTALAGTVFLLACGELLSRTKLRDTLLFLGRNTLALLFLNGIFFSLFEPALSEILLSVSRFSLLISLLVLAGHLIFLPIIGPIVDSFRKHCTATVSGGVAWLSRTLIKP